MTIDDVGDLPDIQLAATRGATFLPAAVAGNSRWL
jgi:hypothetical protein